MSEQVPLASPYYHRASAPTYQSDPPTSKAQHRFTADKSLAHPSWDTPIPCPHNAISHLAVCGVGGRVGPLLSMAASTPIPSLQEAARDSKHCLHPLAVSTKGISLAASPQQTTAADAAVGAEPQARSAAVTPAGDLSARDCLGNKNHVWWTVKVGSFSAHIQCTFAGTFGQCLFA